MRLKFFDSLDFNLNFKPKIKNIGIWKLVKNEMWTEGKNSNAYKRCTHKSILLRLHADNPYCNFFLLNDIELWYPHFLIENFRHFFSISMALLFCVLLQDQHTSRKCYGCKDDSESHKNVTFWIIFLRVTVKRSREKNNSKKQRNSSMLLWQKTVYLKVLLQKMFEITAKEVRLDSRGRLRCGSTDHESYAAWGIQKDGTFNLTRLLLVVISKTFCSKTFK